MKPAEVLALPVLELIRRSPSIIRLLADLGIGPRYLGWTVEAAARDLGLNRDRVGSRLSAALPVA